MTFASSRTVGAWHEARDAIGPLGTSFSFEFKDKNTPIGDGGKCNDPSFQSSSTFMNYFRPDGCAHVNEYTLDGLRAGCES